MEAKHNLKNIQDFFEQDNCNISKIQPLERMKRIDCFIKEDPTLSQDAAFECINMPVDDPYQNTLDISKSITVG